MLITMSTELLRRMRPENREFIGMAKQCGWSQAEIARQLLLTRGAVSQIFHGKTRPHRRTLYLFKMGLTRRENTGLKPLEGVPGLNAWEFKVLAWLRRLHHAHQQRFFEALQLMVKEFAPGSQLLA